MITQKSEVLGRYSGSLTLPEIAYNLVRYRFKKIDIFGYIVRVPINYASELEEKVSSLQVMLEITDVKYIVRSNHTMIEVAMYDKDLSVLTIDFHLYFGFAVIDGKKYKQGSKLRRISVGRPLYRAQFLNEVYEENSNFSKAIDFAVKICLTR